MPPKSRKKKEISPNNNSLYEIELLDLEKLKRGELQKIAKQLGLNNTSKSETLKKNILEFIKKSKLSKTTRLDTQLPRDLQDLVFEKVYEMSNPEIENKIKEILDKEEDIGDANMIYNYSKIRKTLKIKHNIKSKELQEKVNYFRNIYIRRGVIRCYFDLKETIDDFTLEALDLLTPKSSDFDNYNRNISVVERRLLSQVKEYNKYAEILKKSYDTHFDKFYVDEFNDLLKSFNKVSKNRVPYLKYGTSGKLSRTVNSTRKIRSKYSYVKSKDKLISSRKVYYIKNNSKKARSL
jgi:hypothetical protein